jgi:hypothetical protein
MGQSPPFIGGFIRQRQPSTGQGQAGKVGTVVCLLVYLLAVPHAVGRVTGGWLG